MSRRAGVDHAESGAGPITVIALEATASEDPRTAAARPAPGEASASDRAQLVVVANRLPIQRLTIENGAGWQASPGGLASALTPVVSGTGGVWIGWNGLDGAPDRDY